MPSKIFVSANFPNSLKSDNSYITKTSQSSKKLDILSGFEEIPVCHAYKVGGNTITEMPASLSDFRNAKPIYKNLKGWGELTPDMIEKGFHALPQTLRDYFQFPLIHGEWDFLAYEDETYSYQEVLNTSAGLAHTLMDQYGIKKGDKVAFSMRNYPEWINCYMVKPS